MELTATLFKKMYYNMTYDALLSSFQFCYYPAKHVMTIVESLCDRADLALGIITPSSQTTAVSATSPSLEDNNVKTPVTMTSADGVGRAQESLLHGVCSPRRIPSSSHPYFAFSSLLNM
jgi:hypothetical protein